MNMKQPTMEEWVNGKLSQLTLEEKAHFLSGVDIWRTLAVPRLGIPQLKIHRHRMDQLEFVEDYGGWDYGSIDSKRSFTGFHNVVAGIGHLLATKMRDKKADILLAPTVCLHRSPLGGRNFESFSGDDPFLRGKLASHYINAVQSHGIATTIKHFAANDQETKRFVVDQTMSERTLRELHLVPSQIALRESNPWCVMANYSKINGIYASNNKRLLTDILRGDICPSVEAGLDLEMPGPPRKRGKNLVDAVNLGYMKESSLDTNVRRILKLIHKTGKYQYPDWQEGREEGHNRLEHQAFLRKAASEGIVLLKNEKNLLPLKLDGIKQIAFIGPNSRQSVAAGGGSASLNPHYRQNPYDRFVKNVASEYPNLKVKQADGCLAIRWIPIFPETCFAREWRTWVVYEVLGNTNFSGKTVHSSHRKSTVLSCCDNLPKSFVPGKRYSYRATGLLTPKTSGKHTFKMFMAYASPEVRQDLEMEAGRTYEVVVEAVSRELDPIPVHYTDELYRDEVMDGSRIGFMEEVKDDLLGDAVQLATESDIVVLVVGNNIEWESEAYDMESMDLPGEQDRLIGEVIKANPNAVVVNQSGSPITMPWINEVSTLMQAWYQGQELGNSLYDVLLGKISPSGKLPVTFPRRLEDTPCFHNFPGENDKVTYGEGVYLCYRHYDKVKIEPLFPFGFGLSYTTFSYSNLRISKDAFSADVVMIRTEVDNTNTGKLDGKESCQFYVAQTSNKERQRQLVVYALGYYDDKKKSWVLDQDAESKVIVGASSRDLRNKKSFRISCGPWTWIN
ncbi:glycosyl hydrolase family 3 C-terminal domain-containing protein [Terfezia claveryi]|nr:glycosyl hydrolase family 3 C-terminal domain-containing protein [Terfezia claveryi]